MSWGKYYYWNDKSFTLEIHWPHNGGYQSKPTCSLNTLSVLYLNTGLTRTLHLHQCIFDSLFGSTLYFTSCMVIVQLALSSQTQPQFSVIAEVLPYFWKLKVSTRCFVELKTCKCIQSTRSHKYRGFGCPAAQRFIVSLRHSTYPLSKRSVFFN